MMAERKEKPVYQALPYQARWKQDQARFKIGLWARQTGKSTACADEVVDDCATRKTMWVLLSRGERQSRELMEKCVFFAEIWKKGAAALGYELVDDQKLGKMEIRFRNGSRIIGLPANPDTARGFSANVVLDEFAFHQDSDRIWTALFPSITRGYKIRVVSTPNGQQNRFYALWSEGGEWTRHQVTILDAVEAGLKVNVTELHDGLKDEIAWQQEYLCQFVDEATAWLGWELIRSCEDPRAGTWNLDSVAPGAPTPPVPTGNLYAGWDVARWHDLSVFALVQQVGDVLWCRGIEEFARQPFGTQLDRINHVIGKGVNRVCVDATGIGEMPAETLKNRWGEFRAEGVKFTNEVKAELAASLRRAFEDKRLRIPVSDPLREDLHSVRRTTTVAGNIRFEGETPGSHADRFWSLALAVHAAGKQVGVGMAVL